ncbi:15294_t:CDS:2, partial [Gigaspora rosea]
PEDAFQKGKEVDSTEKSEQPNNIMQIEELSLIKMVQNLMGDAETVISESQVVDGKHLTLPTLSYTEGFTLVSYKRHHGKKKC